MGVTKAVFLLCKEDGKSYRSKKFDTGYGTSNNHGFEQEHVTNEFFQHGYSRLCEIDIRYV